jgi:hypothetical protein
MTSSAMTSSRDIVDLPKNLFITCLPIIFIFSAYAILVIANDHVTEVNQGHSRSPKVKPALKVIQGHSLPKTFLRLSLR